MFAFFAALNILDSRALYSQHTVRELMDPMAQGTRNALERHHLFPTAYLKKEGLTDQRDYNQIANFAILEWGDNTKIGDTPPHEYVPTLEARFDSTTLQAMYRDHALPLGWETMGYGTFLRERRSLMAQTIRTAYERLAGQHVPTTTLPSVSELIAGGESSAVEFKSTLRTNLHTGERDPRMELAVLKTVAGFLNTKGGTLVVGVADNGTPVGLQADGFPDEDKMALHLINLLKERIGGHQALYVHLRFDDYEQGRVLVVACQPAKAPVFVKDGQVERFFVRYGPSTQELTGTQAQEFIKQRFAIAA